MKQHAPLLCPYGRAPVEAVKIQSGMLAIPLRRRWTWLAFALLIAMVPAIGLAQPPLVGASEAATPLTVVAPEFPASASAGASGTRVDVAGTIFADGKFDPITIKTDPGQEQFASAVADVLKWWRFVPAIDPQLCAPKQTPSEFAVWFEGSAASPKVFFSFPKSGKVDERPTGGSLKGPEVEYPRQLLGVEGQVRVLYLATAEGKVLSAVARSSTPYGMFDDVVLAAARQSTIVWKEPKRVENGCAEAVFQFCMAERKHAKVKFGECREGVRPTGMLYWGSGR
jgi:TonB family protein